MTPDGKPRKRRRSAPAVLVFGLVVQAAAAAWTSYLLTARHLMRSQADSGVLEMMCGKAGGCDAVLQSQWASMGNIPLGALGIAYFGMLGTWWLVVGAGNRRGRFWHVVPLVMNAGGVLFSIELIVVMFARIREACGGCLFVHGVNVVMLAVALALWRVLGRADGGDPRPGPRLAVSGLLLMAMVFTVTVAGTAVAMTKLQYRAAQRYIDGFHRDADLMRYAYEREERREIELGDDALARGPEDAPHTLVVFSDFDCSHCKKLAELLAGEVREKYGSELRVIFRHHLLHDQSREAALAVEAAGLVGGADGFWRMHDKLFEVQGRLRQADWGRWATEAGLDGQRVVAAMADEQVVARVKQSVAQSRELGVRGTPTLFLDGRRLKVWMHIEIWDTILGGQTPAAVDSPDD